MVEKNKNYLYVGNAYNLRHIKGIVGNITNIFDERFVEFSVHVSGTEFESYRVLFSNLRIAE